MEYLRVNEAFQFFEPNKKSEEFINLVASSTEIPCVFSAANGTSKTATVVNILANLIWPGRNKYFNQEMFKNWPYPKRIRYITDPELVKDIGPFHSEIKKWWPKGQWRGEKAGKGYYSQYHAGEWVVDVMTYDQDVQQFEGGTLGAIVMDEPPPRPIFNASVGRLRLGGKLMVVMTPLTQAAWFYDEVVPRIPNNIVFADIEDACIEHGVRGHLKHENIQTMLDNWPQEEIEARARGKALYLSGLIYKTFNYQIHVLKESVRPPANATIYQVIDPHSDKPFAIIWAFVDRRGDVTIFDEWPNVDFTKWHNCQLTIKDYLAIFRDKEQGLNVYKRIIDRHFAEVSHLTGMVRNNLRDEFRNVGMDLYPSYQASEEIETGIGKVREYLRYNPDRPLDVTNKPKLFINPGCANTIKSFLRWARNPENGKVQEQYKDFMDCVRYLVMSNPEVDEPIPADIGVAKKLW